MPQASEHHSWETRRRSVPAGPEAGFRVAVAAAAATAVAGALAFASLQRRA